MDVEPGGEGVMAEELPPGRHDWMNQSQSAVISAYRKRARKWTRAATTQAFQPFVPPPPYYVDLLTLGDDLVREGRYELAVVVAQMACEVVVEQTLTPFLRDTRPKTYDLSTPVINAYMQWTRDRTITKQPFWKAYCRHAMRRHGVVHAGKRVDPSEARDSTMAARQFVSHVDNVRTNVLSAFQ